MTPTFCRHNRFIDRCPICRETVPGPTPARQAAKQGRQAGADRRAGTRSRSETGAQARGSARSSTRRATEVRVHREQRSSDDGYRCSLVPGLHSSEDALRLAQEIGFASGRLNALTVEPPSLYAEARACDDIEQATWMCFLAAYISPLQDAQPFVGIRQALLRSWASGAVPDLAGVPLGPRTSHDPVRGSETLIAYRRFTEHVGSQEAAFTGEEGWTPQRRFERLFERLALPGFGRAGRYDLLVTLGRLGLYELSADSLHLVTSSSALASDRTLQAAKRVFGIGDSINIERRAFALVQALSTPVEALDLALWNWSLPVLEGRVTLGFPDYTGDAHAVERAQAALEV